MKRAQCTALLAVLTACVGTDVGNPAGDDGGPVDPDAEAPGDPVLVDLDVPLYGYDSAESAQGLLPSGAHIDLAWIALDRVRLRQAPLCEDEVEQDLRGPIPIDMLAPEAPDPLRGLEYPAGGYCRMQVRWDALEETPEGDVPSNLFDHSILFEGKRADGTRFVLRSDRGDRLRLDAVDDEEGFPIDDATGALFVALDAEVLFAGVDLDSAEVGAGGVIRIDDDANSELLDRFEENLDDAASLFEDLDGDGALDEDERAPGEELAE